MLRKKWWIRTQSQHIPHERHITHANTHCNKCMFEPSNQKRYMTCPSIKQCFFCIYFLILNVYDTINTRDEIITCNINRFTNITLFDEMISNFWILITAWLQYTFDVIGFFLSAMPLWWILKGRKKWKERYAEFIRNYSAHLPVMIGDFSKEANR